MLIISQFWSEIATLSLVFLSPLSDQSTMRPSSFETEINHKRKTHAHSSPTVGMSTITGAMPSTDEAGRCCRRRRGLPPAAHRPLMGDARAFHRRLVGLQAGTQGSSTGGSGAFHRRFRGLPPAGRGPSIGDAGALGRRLASPRAQNENRSFELVNRVPSTGHLISSPLTDSCAQITLTYELNQATVDKNTYA